MSSKPVLSSAGRALTPGAIALMLMLCLSWGFNQIAVNFCVRRAQTASACAIASAVQRP